MRFPSNLDGDYSQLLLGVPPFWAVGAAEWGDVYKQVFIPVSGVVTSDRRGVVHPVKGG